MPFHSVARTWVANNDALKIGEFLIVMLYLTN